MITTPDKLTFIRREIDERNRVAPFRIRQGMITAAQAERDVTVLRAIEADLETLAEKERLL